MSRRKTTRKTKPGSRPDVATSSGYFRFPTIRDDTIVFCAEDDLWSVAAEGGEARRLTANPGPASRPALSPDGVWLAFSSRDEGAPEVYVMRFGEPGPARRLTYLGATTRVLGWTPDGKRIVFVSDAARPFAGDWCVWEVSPEGGEPSPLPWGPALGLARLEAGAAVLWRNGGGRNQGDPAWWKRYRGGRAGQLWIDPTGNGKFRRLLELEGDLASPMWVGRRVYFLCDHEGVGNVYSCTPTGKALERHTDHSDFYIRTPQTDGRRIVYSCGGDLWVLDPRRDETRRLEIRTGSARPQRNRKFVAPGRTLQHYALHPEGHSLCVTARGRPFTFAHWEGAVTQHGENDGVRYRFARWLPDGERLLAVSDGGGEEHFVVLEEGRERAVRTKVDIGRVDQVAVAPVGPDRVAVASHRNEVFLVQLRGGQARQIDRSEHGVIGGLAWSPDGRWLVYSFPETRTSRVLKAYSVEKDESHSLTRPEFFDLAPTFDPDGGYLYFLSQREFNPVYDTQTFDLGFPRGMKIMALPLRKELGSPFEARPRAPAEDSNRKPRRRSGKPKPVRIDLAGIADRVIACPVGEGRFGQLLALPDRLLFTSLPIEGGLGRTMMSRLEPSARARLESYDLVEQRRETVAERVSEFGVSLAGDVIVYRRGDRLRVLRAGSRARPSESMGRESGWIDLGRLRISVEPGAEWRQMFIEAWRLQRDHFWSASMSGVPWQAIRDRYLPLVDRVACRSELSDLIWEMQGELGTSHAYEMGGDYRPVPHYRQGFLGVDFAYDGRAGAWRVVEILRGDSWDPDGSSPLAAPGVNLKPLDRLVAIGSRRLSRELSPGQCLVNMARQKVELTIADRSGKRVRRVTVRALASEESPRYRQWVEANRRLVHEKSRGRIGYIHVPDMGPGGFAEFHRYFRMELDRDGLVVDVRYNRGGHVSQLLLEKLLRKRIGYGVARWNVPYPYPIHAPSGPMACVTNERAGSDGDIFSHAFKLYGLGPLVGTRTWGGVVGIGPRHSLIDGSLTTQPEYFFWWSDVGFGIENYGTDPDLEVEILPHDHARGRDPQLERAIAEVQRQLRETPPVKPDFSRPPVLPSAKLARRGRRK